MSIMATEVGDTERIEEIKESLNSLIKLQETDKVLFSKTYRSLPFELYKEIERLSVSKSIVFSELCDKSKFVSDSFHKSIK